jgi:hypothetical protein
MTLNEIREWVKLAKLDGWKATDFAPHESQDTAVILEREGFKLFAFMRPVGMFGFMKEQAEIDAWAPDSLTIDIDFPYDWDRVRRAAHICGFCHKYSAKTMRVQFAMRACPTCHIRHAPILEQDGWTR